MNPSLIIALTPTTRARVFTLGGRDRLAVWRAFRLVLSLGLLSLGCTAPVQDPAPEVQFQGQTWALYEVTEAPPGSQTERCYRVGSAETDHEYAPRIDRARVRFRGAPAPGAMYGWAWPREPFEVWINLDDPPADPVWSARGREEPCR